MMQLQMVVLSLVLPMEADDIEADDIEADDIEADDIDTYCAEPGVRQILGVPLRNARNC